MLKAVIPVTFVFVRSTENCGNDLKHISINSTNSLSVSIYILALWTAHDCTGKKQGKRMSLL